MNDRLSRMPPFAIFVGSVLIILTISIAWDNEARPAAPKPEYERSPFFLPLGAY
ncbi:MAG: hypothetical protein HYS06_01485 [Methylocystis sp.]|nr:hypothetical protein [Methylocystis sp.]